MAHDGGFYYYSLKSNNESSCTNVIHIGEQKEEYGSGATFSISCIYYTYVCATKHTYTKKCEQTHTHVTMHTHTH
jgi:hypothetical protein